MIRTTLVSFALLGAVATAGADTVETFQTEIGYTADLLEVRAGADVVLEEIERQARTACNAQFGWSLPHTRMEKNCVRDIVSDAVAQIDNGFLFEASIDAGYTAVTRTASIAQ